jgi:hypothetical protein
MSTQRTYRIAGSQLTIDFGNVLDVSAEVVVSSDDYQLSMGLTATSFRVKNGRPRSSGSWTKPTSSSCS